MVTLRTSAEINTVETKNVHKLCKKTIFFVLIDNDIKMSDDDVTAFEASELLSLLCS